MSENAQIHPAVDPPASAAPHWTVDLKLLLLLAGPSVATMVAESLLNLVDFWIASRLGPPAQAAVLSATMVYMSVFGALMGTMACVCTVVSQSFGAHRPRDCSAYAWQGVWISLAFGATGFLLWPAVPGLYRWIGHAPDVQAMEVSYTRIRLLIVGVAGANMALAEYFNGIQRPRVNTASVIGANVVNALLGYGLVFGLWGLPRVGFVGIAAGTAVATILRAVWLLSVFCMGPLAERFHSRGTWQPNLEKMGRLVRVGWPAGVQFVVDITAWTVFLAAIIGKFGTANLAASNTCVRVTDLSFMPAVGIGFAISSLVGQSIGQGRPDIARRRARLGVIINMGYMGIMALVFVFFGRHLVGVFSQDPEVITLGASVLVVASIYQMFDAAAISYNLALRGAGDTLFPAVMSAMLSWGVLVGGSWYAAEYHREWGIKGPWGFAAFTIVVVGLILWWRWRRGNWEKLDTIGLRDPLAEEQARTLDPLVAREVIAADGATIGSSERGP